MCIISFRTSLHIVIQTLTNNDVLAASFGGLLSLLLGFTLIAGFDLVIFFFFGVVYSSLVRSNKVKGKNVQAENINRSSKGNRIYVQQFRSNITGKAVNFGKQ